jgi:hypothetical protein
VGSESAGGEAAEQFKSGQRLKRNLLYPRILGFLKDLIKIEVVLRPRSSNHSGRPQNVYAMVGIELLPRYQKRSIIRVMESIPTHPAVETGAPEGTAETLSAGNIEAPLGDVENKVFENPAEDPLIIDTEERIADAADGRFEKIREEIGDDQEEVSEEELWERAYEEESVEQWNKFTEENPEKVEKYRQEKKKWYEKARAKAEEIIKALDPEYEVVVENSIVSPDDNNRAEYRTVTLAFRSPKGPGQSWTMEIEPSEGYIQNRLPGAIKKVYEQRQEGFVEQNTGKRNVEGIQEIKFDFSPTKDERYLSSELDRLGRLEQIKADVGAELGEDTEPLRQALLEFKQPKRFILDRGTMRQRTLEIAVVDGVVSLTEKIARGNKKNIWRLAESDEVSGSENTSIGGLKEILDDFNTQIKARLEKGEVAARVE